MDRFWSKVDRRGPDECWNWKAHAGKKGYGRFHYQRKLDRAHRVSWMLVNGPIPVGKCVLHHCDNPSCVNPEHLYVGTQADNARDMLARDRKKRGVERANAKLTDQDVVTMRQLYSDGNIGQRDLAARFGISRGVLWLILKGRRWTHV